MLQTVLNRVMGPLDQILALFEACPRPKPLPLFDSNIPCYIRTVEDDTVPEKETLKKKPVSEGQDVSKRRDKRSAVHLQPAHVGAAELDKQLKQLETLAKIVDADFVKALLKTFPPDHLSADKRAKLDLRETNMKSLLRKLIGIYHPDKLDRVKNGENYCLLCGRITAQLNAKYEKYK